MIKIEEAGDEIVSNAISFALYKGIVLFCFYLIALYTHALVSSGVPFWTQPWIPGTVDNGDAL